MRKSKKDEKERAERQTLLRAWKRFHAEQLEEALTGIHANVMCRLMAQLKELRSARELVSHIASENWSLVDNNTRVVCLHEINVAICRLREKLGLPPIDDALDDEPARAFQIVKMLINRFPAPSRGSPPEHPGKQ